MPYPDKGSNIFFGFLHSRTNQHECNSTLGPNLFLHVPLLFIILRTYGGIWHPIYLSQSPSIIAGHNMSESLQQLMDHHIQDPVSLAKYDNDSGDVYLTINMADDSGRCAVGLYKNLLPVSSASRHHDWVLYAAENFKAFNETKAQEYCIASLMKTCQDRYNRKSS